MAKTEFRIGVDGNGRVRFFVDNAEHLLDEYVAKYIKAYGVMPEIPVGLGGRAVPDPVKVDEVAELKAKLEQLQAQVAAMNAPSAAAEALVNLTKGVPLLPADAIGPSLEFIPFASVHTAEETGEGD